MLVSLMAIAAVAQTAPEMRLMRFPTVYQDSVVFTYAGDLWQSSIEGGLARRLTSFAGPEQHARYSPDGKWIAFTGTYDGNPDVYVVSADGGDPKRLTFESGPDQVRGWTPDGKIAYVSAGQSPGAFTAALRFISPEGGFPTLTKLMEVSDVDFFADGEVVFNRSNSHGFNWRRYRGGTQGRIGFSNTAGSTYKEIKSDRENRWQPQVVGDTVYYIGDKNAGTRNLYSYNRKTGKETQVTNNADADIRWPDTDGKTMVWERNGYLEAMDVATGKVRRLSTKIAGDLNLARPKMMEYGQYAGEMSLSPSGNRIAVAGRGEIFSVPARSGETRHIGGDSSSKESAPNWSPDGKTIAFLSDKSGEARIYTMPQMGGEWTELALGKGKKITNFDWSPDGKKISFTTVDLCLFIFDMDSKKETLVHQDTQGLGGYDWSPDSAWIAHTATSANLFGQIKVFEVATGKSTAITDGYYNETSVSFDRTGRYLYFVSARTFNPTPSDFEFNVYMTNSQRVYALPLQASMRNPLLPPSDEEPAGNEPRPAQAGGPPGGAPAGPPPTKIDFEGISGRAIGLPWAPGSYQGVLGLNNGVMTFSGGQALMFDFSSRQPQTVLGPGWRGLTVSHDRSRIAWLSATGNIGISPIQPGLDPIAGARTSLANAEAINNPRDEWEQMFWESWRWQRDRYYDKDMLGLDWNAIGKQYADMLPYVSSRADLSYVLGLMLGELGTGHAYVQGGDMGVSIPAIPTGMLGADYELSGGKVRFKKIYRGLNFEEGRRGPLGDPGVDVREGDYLIAVDGKEVGANNPHQHLVGKVGRTVKITVNSSPTSAGARIVTVRPIADENQLRYIEWVEDNRRKVSEMSGGKIGYLHVPDTQLSGMIEFAKGFYNQSDKEAVIIDERFNGGGFIPTMFIELLNRQVQTAFRQRNGADVGFPPSNLDMPKAMLINEYAGSGGDMLPWLFKRNGLGPLIGTRTWGGLVGITGSAPLVDGGGVTAPEFGLYDVEKGQWIAENTGVDPDIEVDNNPAVIAAGQDAQLKKAVEFLQGQIKNGKKPWKKPDFPRVAVRRGG